MLPKHETLWDRVNKSNDIADTYCTIFALFRFFFTRTTHLAYALILIILISCGGGGGGTESGTVSASSYPIAVIGDSLSRDVAPYFPADNLAVGGASTVDMIDRIQVEDLSSYEKIYVMAGINDLVVDGWEVDAILSHYSDLLDIIRAKTKAVIIVQSTLPIYDREVNKDVQKLNRGLQSLAMAKGLRYFDLWVLFLDLDTGALYATKTTDGVHLTGDACREWAEYIK